MLAFKNHSFRAAKKKNEGVRPCENAGDMIAGDLELAYPGGFGIYAPEVQTEVVG